MANTFAPVFVLQYRIGQLYMISKHSHEQSDRGEGVEVVQNEPYEDPNHGNGQLTEKRVYLNRQVLSSCFPEQHAAVISSHAQCWRFVGRNISLRKYPLCFKCNVFYWLQASYWQLQGKGQWKSAVTWNRDLFYFRAHFPRQRIVAWRQDCVENQHISLFSFTLPHFSKYIKQKGDLFKRKVVCRMDWESLDLGSVPHPIPCLLCDLVTFQENLIFQGAEHQ